MSRQSLPITDKMLKHSYPQDNGCILWTGPIDSKGYGVLKHGPISFRAHRIAYSLKHGAIPTGLNACHTCDTPSCVNPDHIFIGTQKDNIHDMIKKNRNTLPPRTRDISPTLKAQIKADISGESLQKLAKKYGVSQTTIFNVRGGSQLRQGNINNNYISGWAKRLAG